MERFEHSIAGVQWTLACRHVYNGTAYYYITNLQGDVVAIIDNTKAIVVQYTYDAWGKLLSTTGTMATTLGVHNPLRYRGYVYDPESSLYYLQSRYYDPALGRFINADAFASTGQGILGNNMFAYCSNNPVLLSDYSGMLAVGSFVALSDMCTGVASNIVIGPSLEGMTGPYNELRKITAGRSEYEVHHLVEKRFYQVPGIGKYKNNPNSAPSVILRKDTHKEYTSSARGKFPYGTNYTEVNPAAVKQFYMTEYGGSKDWLDLIVSCFE